MTSKRTLVKQKVTYGSVGDDNLHDSDDGFSGKRTLTKRVSFESHELSESDSDAENSLGRINRTSGGRAGDSLGGLFRETSTKERERSVELIKRTSEDSRASKDKGEPKPAARPRPTISPRQSHFEGHPVTTSQQSSDEDDVASGTWPARTKQTKERHPVAPPRTSPRQHQEKSYSPDMTSSTPVPRARPVLSPREGRLKLFERDPDVDEYERTKNVERGGGIEYERSKNLSEKPMVPVRRRKTLDETYENDTGGDGRIYESERTRNVPGERPVVHSRRKKTLEEEHEKDTGRDHGVYKSERTRNVPGERPVVHSRRKKTLEEEHEKDTGRDHRVYKSERTRNVPGERPVVHSRMKKTLEETHEKDIRRDGRVYESERTRNVSGEKPMVQSRKEKTFEETHEKGIGRDGRIYESERTRNVPGEKPVVQSRKKKTFEETHEKDTERDGRIYEPEKTKNVPGEKPSVHSRRKKTLEETREKHTKKDEGVYDYERAKNVPDKPMAPLRRKKTLEETHEIRDRPQIPTIRTSTFEDDGPFHDNDRMTIEQDGNLRQYKKVRGQRVVSVTREDSSEESEDEVDSARVLYRKDSFGSQKYYDDDELSHGRTVTDAKGKSVTSSPRPSPRSHAMVDNSMKIHERLEEEVKHAKRPGSAPVMKKASSLETLSSRQGSLAKKGSSGANEHGAHRVQLKKSLTPQRPTSGKKGSLLAQLRQKTQSDITDTFEEHVPSTENVIDTAPDDRGFKRKGDTGGSRAMDAPKPQRSGPLKANQGIDAMTRSPHHREMPPDHWTDTKDASYRGSVTPKRSSSMTNLRGTSPEPWGGDSDRSSQHSGFMDTASIREAVFDEWKSRKSVKLREEMASKSAEKKKQQEKEQEERERKKVAKRAFESWNEMKQERNKEVNANKKESMEKELEKHREKNLKARDAKKYFESWKAKKDEELKEQHHKKKQKGREENKKEEEDKEDKSKTAQKVFDNWKKNKDEKIKEGVKKKRKEEKESMVTQEDENYERSIQCSERYQEWVEKKGKPQRGPPPPTLTQRSWCPSGRKSANVIPDKVGSVIQAPAPNRSRTMSGSYYFKTSKF